MSDHGTTPTTGLPGLDRVLKGILPGDNIVWQVGAIGDYRAMVTPFCQARQRILMGQFPDHIVKQFEQMLDYFGQSPIIVRSSSLLEDNFGNSFAGKYESVFCPNQGPRERRLEDFLAAVRTIYASTMSEKALRYREQRGILDHDEQMALLVMRVSGAGGTMLLGPGRWGTSDPFLGIPVTFAEINRAAVLCEIVAMHEHLVPDVSLGTHFLNEVVETDMLYLALFPQRGNNYLRADSFENAPNRLLEIVPKAGPWADAVRVIDGTGESGENVGIFLDADAFEQRVVCYFER